jgi:RHS repeat-associated protein
MVTRTREDGAVQKATMIYDVFGLGPVSIQTDATNSDGTALPSLTTTITRDPLTLNVLSTADPNGTRVGQTFDGFDRVRLSTVTPQGGATGVLSSISYVGFAVGETGGQRIMQNFFTDPVAPANVATAPSRSGTVFFDALGRRKRAELALGADYGNQVLIASDRFYDTLGRVHFEADPYLSGQNINDQYGTTFFFNPDGTPACFIRGTGPQTLNNKSDEGSERYPTCFSRFFADNRELVDTQYADALLPGSPQTGVVYESSYSATGQLLKRATYKTDASAGTRAELEDALFDYDQLGHLIRMTRRHQRPQVPIAVATEWHFDSLGQVLELDEPDSAPQFRSYNNWGQLIQVHWCDATTSPCSDLRTVTKYDALGRVTHTEDRTNNVVDAETVNDYTYDQPATFVNRVTPTNVRGRLASASWPTGRVVLSYDALGRVDARGFDDRHSNSYIEKHAYHGDGSPSRLHLLLPDDGFKDERVDYIYDTAGKLRTARYSDGTGGVGMPLFNIETIDAFGRIRQARIGLPTVNGPASYSANYADTGRRLLLDVKVTSATGAASREISHQPIPGTVVAVRAYDPLGRERVRRESKDGVVAPANVSTYDALGRLDATFALDSTTGVTAKVWQFAYDPLGNILSETDFSSPVSSSSVTLSYQSTDRDRICNIGYGSAAPSPACDVKYDGMGNIIEQKSRSNGTRKFKYFANGQVKQIVDGNGNVAKFRYDAFGAVQQLDLTGNTPDTRHDRHLGELIAVRDETTNGTTTTSVITRRIPGPGFSATRHGPAGPWIFALGEGRGNRFFLEAGDFVQDVSYQPYGQSTSTGQPPHSARYSSEQWNGGDALAALGLSQLGARIYDPAIGRFLSRDPLIIPRSAAATNAYAFAMNDPVNRADPTGLDVGAECPICQPPPFPSPGLEGLPGGPPLKQSGGGSKPKGPVNGPVAPVPSGSRQLHWYEFGPVWPPHTLVDNPLFTPLDQNGNFVLSPEGRDLFGTFLQRKYGNRPNFDRVTFRVDSSSSGGREQADTTSDDGVNFLITLDRNRFWRLVGSIAKEGVVAHELVHVLQEMMVGKAAMDSRTEAEYRGLDLTKAEVVSRLYTPPDWTDFLISQQRLMLLPVYPTLTLEQSATLGQILFVQEERLKAELSIGAQNGAASGIEVP